MSSIHSQCLAVLCWVFTPGLLFPGSSEPLLPSTVVPGGTCIAPAYQVKGLAPLFLTGVQSVVADTLQSQLLLTTVHPQLNNLSELHSSLLLSGLMPAVLEGKLEGFKGKCFLLLKFEWNAQDL